MSNELCPSHTNLMWYWVIIASITKERIGIGRKEGEKNRGTSFDIFHCDFIDFKYKNEFLLLDRGGINLATESELREIYKDANNDKWTKYHREWNTLTGNRIRIGKNFKGLPKQEFEDFIRDYFE